MSYECEARESRVATKWASDHILHLHKYKKYNTHQLHSLVCSLH